MYVTGPEGLATSVDDGETWSIEALAPVRDENGEVFSTGSRVPGHAYCRGMIIKPDDPDTMFIGTGNTVPGEIGGIQRTRDGGATWEYVALPVVPNSLVYWLGTHAETPDVIAAASIFGYVYLSEDGGETWMKPRRDVLPAFGNREVADIKLRDMAPALNKLSHVLRQRTRSVLRDTFKLAMADGELSVNPAGETMDALLCKSSHKPIHYAAVSWQDIPGLYGMLDDDMAALCIRFGILAAARPSETREAKWNEIDLEQSVWEVPAARMKKGRAHRVPLSDEAVAVLALARKHGGDGPYLFPARRSTMRRSQPDQLSAA